jgi:alpha-L-fucosidase
LNDGSELSLARPWNVPQDSADLYLSLPRTSLPDELDTVIELELGE